MALKNPILSNPITVDIPKLNEILDALSKANPTDVDGISTGAMRLYEVSSGKWQWQVYNGSTWASVPFLQHNVDQLDGYHAAITPAANTVAVRNASGLLEDSITGNAATASSAATLSETLPVNKGGTGATASAQARTNLGVPPTSHASTNTTHGVGNATQYGHLKLSDATNSSSGVSGGVAATPAAVKAAKDAADAAQSSANSAQSSADAAMTKASTLATSSTPGIVKPGTGMTVDAAGALNVNTSSASTPGLVKSSTTAAAGAVPLGGADGTMDKGWFGTLPADIAAVSSNVNTLTTNFNAFVANVNSLATVAERLNSSGTNWMRYESGIQLCWGEGVTNQHSGITITLPVQYANGAYNVSVATAGTNESKPAQIALYVERNLSTGFTVWSAAGGASAPGVGFLYFTIGRWK